MIATFAAALLLAPSVSDITEPDILGRLKYLASPDLAGRMTLTEGERKAAAYIVNEFRRFGLKPPEGEDYVFEYPLTNGNVATKNNMLVIQMPGNKRINAVLGKDFQPLYGTTTQIAEGQAVFAGYGMQDNDRDDYGGQDVKGRFVFVLPGAPAGVEPVPVGKKGRIASRLGAAGLIVIGGGGEKGQGLPVLSQWAGLWPDTNILGATITPGFFEKVSGLKLSALKASTKPAARSLNLRVRGITETAKKDGKATDVVAILPGNDPKLRDEFILIGGHFDHMGVDDSQAWRGQWKLFGGADDNASGTTGVLELAEYYASTKSNRRTLVFNCFSGEELGLLGSSAWAKAHPEMLKKTEAMINLDMIGHLREGKLSLYGGFTCAEFSKIPTWTAPVAGPAHGGLKVMMMPEMRYDSDHATFVVKKVPSLFFFTDVHPDYHTERDTVDKINLAGMVQVLKAVDATVRGLDALDTKPEFIAPGTKGAGH